MAEVILADDLRAEKVAAGRRPLDLRRRARQHLLA
jgi:hypothetical protein